MFTQTCQQLVYLAGSSTPRIHSRHTVTTVRPGIPTARARPEQLAPPAQPVPLGLRGQPQLLPDQRARPAPSARLDLLAQPAALEQLARPVRPGLQEQQAQPELPEPPAPRVQPEPPARAATRSGTARGLLRTPSARTATSTSTLRRITSTGLRPKAHGPPA